MATTTKHKKDWEEIYDGFKHHEVGAGTIDPSIYSDPLYAKKKTQKIIIGGLNLINYGAWDHDQNPLILTIGYVAKYNVIFAYNLHYIPLKFRKAMIEFVIKTNIKRIRKGQPIIIDYDMMKRAIPVSTKIIRMYKVVAIRVVETYPLRSWGEAIKNKSKWEKHYKQQRKQESVFDKFLRSIRNLF